MTLFCTVIGVDMNNAMKKAVFLLAGVTIAGCGKPPIAVPAGAPGTEAVLVAPQQKEDEAPAALGESSAVIKKDLEKEKKKQELIAKVQDPKEAEKIGFKIQTLKEGTGEGAKDGQSVTVHYTGTLENGREFDSSRSRDPFKLKLGAGEVIAGWDLGLKGMKKGEQRKLTIPAELGYGERGMPPSIPPNATLLFDVEMIDIK